MLEKLKKLFHSFIAFFKKDKSRHFLIDASILADGRILGIVKSKFVNVKLYTAQFIIDDIKRELSAKMLIKRERAKRAILVFEKLRSSNALKVSNKNFPELKEMDDKIVALSKSLNITLFTADFKLYKDALCANAQSILFDSLLKAFRPIYLPGENIMVFLVKEGAQVNQAVGYLDDGTMVVAEGAGKFIGKRVELTLTSVRQTSASKIIFGKVSQASNVLNTPTRVRHIHRNPQRRKSNRP
jgi:uncharacterized protein YacL